MTSLGAETGFGGRGFHRTGVEVIHKLLHLFVGNVSSWYSVGLGLPIYRIIELIKRACAGLFHANHLLPNPWETGKNCHYSV